MSPVRRRRRPPSPSPAGLTPSEFESAKADAYRLIARRTRTRNEIRGRLRQRGHREDVIEQTLADLADLGYLDDSAFAREWCRYRLEGRPLGVRGLRRELFEKGVPADIAEGAVKEVFENVDEAELAKRLAMQRVEKGLDVQNAKGIRQMRDFLLRRGFSINSVNEALAAAGGTWTHGSSTTSPQWSGPEKGIYEN
ncbi:MAG: regulatory protein RecX [Nitrospinota bacterium]